MAPGQELVQVPEFLVKLVVFGWTDQNNLDQAHRIFSNRICQRPDARIRPDSLAVLHPRFNQFSRDPVLT